MKFDYEVASQWTLQTEECKTWQNIGLVLEGSSVS